ncbi:response regulator [Paenibacillus radicis (ex Xue et al. 2023)]|uniref:Response regulator n=1 Tax=Paenibacillus radicis (ex Xue et al. 2023) TaxID=2972489 RepID=A0ABT1YSI1_9BACL|nr:response regulator [Paenibacillus radicis (ex Xue et al. 2023)]MCR8635248.1 response regulator [Paenibacillus radicis (ex Xue et al. 2023)]
MKVMLVDDERLALVRLENMLGEYRDCKVIGSFSRAELALNHIGEFQPDAVFLDIHMPGLNGLRATERIHTTSPNTKIVYVTAYDEHAVEAFELGATDYLVKPLRRERLGQTIERLRERISIMKSPNEKGLLYHCLGAMQIRKTDGELEFLKWRSTKAKELFAYLLFHRGKVINKNTLLELLWPELDDPKGLANLQTSINRIRSTWKNTFGDGYISIRYSQYGYILESKELRIDAEEWEQGFRQLNPVSIEHVTEHQRLLDMYRGNFYEEDNYVWAERERQRLKALWLQHAQHLGQFYSSHDMNIEALRVYHQIQERDPLNEDSYLALMNIYASLNDTDSVDKQYQFMIRILEQEAGVDPSPAVMEWYARWRNRVPSKRQFLHES